MIRIQYRTILPSRFLVIALAVSLMTWGYLGSKDQSHFYHVRPPEVTFLSVIFGPEYKPTINEEFELQHSLNKLLSLPEEPIVDYPLYRKIAAINEKHSPDSLPDIIIIAVESLRGVELIANGRTDEPNRTPHLNKLIRESVYFPQFISNGWPTTEGFFSINTSIPPHRVNKIVTDYQHINFESIPHRLSDFGYSSMIFWGHVPGWDDKLHWSERWYDEVIYPGAGTGKWMPNISDGELFKGVKKKITDHDKNGDRNPLLIYVGTTDTHTPYDPSYGVSNTEELRTEALKFSTSGIDNLHDRYLTTLKYVDLQIGKFIDFLDSRDKSENTLIFLMGDHSYPVGETFDQDNKYAPNDAYVWTGGLIRGPQRLIGQARRLEFPASQVDVMPTILSILGDTKPVGVFGQNLLSSDSSQERFAISIRPGGFRLDKGDYSLFVSSKNPNEWWTLKSFTQENYKKVFDQTSSFNKEQAVEFYDLVYYTSYLIEQNRIKPD